MYAYVSMHVLFYLFKRIRKIYVCILFNYCFALRICMVWYDVSKHTDVQSNYIEVSKPDCLVYFTDSVFLFLYLLSTTSFKTINRPVHSKCPSFLPSTRTTSVLLTF